MVVNAPHLVALVKAGVEFPDGEADTLDFDINHQQIAIPWLGHLVLQIELAQQPVGLAANPRMVRQRVFANSIPPLAP